MFLKRLNEWPEREDGGLNMSSMRVTTLTYLVRELQDGVDALARENKLLQKESGDLLSNMSVRVRRMHDAAYVRINIKIYIKMLCVL